MKLQTLSLLEAQPSPEPAYKADPKRTLSWLGGVSYQNLDRVMAEIRDLLAEDASKEICLMVNSYGGTTGIGLSFYDAARGWLGADLTTIGSGDVDSSGIIVFLAGKRRFLTKNTTLLFHQAGRTFAAEKRFTAADMEAMVNEDRLKDYQYACVISDATGGRHSAEDILELMRRNTILTADEAVRMGLAHKVL